VLPAEFVAAQLTCAEHLPEGPLGICWIAAQSTDTREPSNPRLASTVLWQQRTLTPALSQGEREWILTAR
jgi:hypothetical protein